MWTLPDQVVELCFLNLLAILGLLYGLRVSHLDW